MTMKSSDCGPAELESELIRLNSLIRARRKQLAFLQRCPNTDCECRAVWKEVTEKKLANGMVLSASARAAWMHEFEPERSTRSSFITAPRTDFTILGAQPAADSARTGAGRDELWQEIRTSIKG